jgi:hypothetical protein
MSSLTPEDFDRFIAGRQARERQEHEALMRMYRAYHRAMDAKETLRERRLLAERKEEDR